MVLEAAPDQPDAVGEQRSGEAVARETGETPTIESEVQLVGAIDRAPVRQATV
jgi:hypothetical protein